LYHTHLWRSTIVSGEAERVSLIGAKQTLPLRAANNAANISCCTGEDDKARAEEQQTLDGPALTFAAGADHGDAVGRDAG
jgi:hypothetical protein